MMFKLLVACLGVGLMAVQVVAAEQPEDTYKAYQAALIKGDGQAALACLTTAQRQRVLFEMAFALGTVNSKLFEEHVDDKRQAQWIKKQGPPQESNMGAFMAEVLRDPDAFFSAGLKHFQDAKSKAWASEEPLRKVVIRGDRARGVVTQYVESIRIEGGVMTRHRDPYDAPIYFAKTKTGWRIDTQTKEEFEKDQPAAKGIKPPGSTSDLLVPLAIASVGCRYGDHRRRTFYRSRPCRFWAIAGP